MNSDSLADLDELVPLCRDNRAREYIVEATKCCESGAYRSAIIAAWVAVCYDIIDKLRELILAGDKEAESLIGAMEQARATNNITESLQFERELLVYARDKFELISDLGFTDLDRLRQDRDRCVHPSFAFDAEAFSPAVELARLHIRSAVTHLLQYPPVQGRYALDRLLSDVDSEYFPSELSKAISFLSSGPLKNSRESLAHGFITALLKKLFASETQMKDKWRYLAALKAVQNIRPDSFHHTIVEELTTIIREIPDDQLHLVSWMLARLHELWEGVEEDMRIRIETYVQNLPMDQLDYLPMLLQTRFLSTQAKQRLSSATREELSDTMYFNFPEAIGDRYIDLYLSSQSFEQANSWASQISLYAFEFSAEQQRRIIEGAVENAQVRGSFVFGAVINSLRDTGIIPEPEFDTLLESNGLIR